MDYFFLYQNRWKLFLRNSQDLLRPTSLGSDYFMMMMKKKLAKKDFIIIGSLSLVLPEYLLYW